MGFDDYTKSWTQVRYQYYYFKSCKKYVKEEIEIKRKNLTDKKQKEYIKKYNIKEGDIMYFNKNGQETPCHATIISSVSDNVIRYAAHTDAHKLKKLPDSEDANSKVYILKMR